MDFISNKKELTFDYANDTELLEKLKRFYTPKKPEMNIEIIDKSRIIA